jgi:hypothetical protein
MNRKKELSEIASIQATMKSNKNSWSSLKQNALNQNEVVKQESSRHILTIVTLVFTFSSPFFIDKDMLIRFEDITKAALAASWIFSFLSFVIGIVELIATNDFLETVAFTANKIALIWARNMDRKGKRSLEYWKTLYSNYEKKTNIIWKQNEVKDYNFIGFSQKIFAILAFLFALVAAITVLY